MISEGYRQEVVVDLDKLSTETYTKGTDALVAGIMEYMKKKGYATGGFDAYVSTKVIAAAGVSSSASLRCWYAQLPTTSSTKENWSTASMRGPASMRRMFTGKKLPV